MLSEFKNNSSYKRLSCKPKNVLESLIQVRHNLELIKAFVRRDIKIRYAQTSLGLIWLFAQPLAYLFGMFFVFNTSFESRINNLPYSLFVATGLMIWTYVSFTTTQTGSSLLGSLEILRKTYFPRIIIPIAKSILGLIDLSVICFFTFVLLMYHQVSISINILALPLILFFTTIVSMGIGTLVSILIVRFRDLQHIIPFSMQLGLFISPVIYPSTVVTKDLPGYLQYVYYLNPVSGLIDAVRWSILGLKVNIMGVVISCAAGLIILSISMLLFNRIERDLSDKL